jgi:uncharacterized protein
VTAPDPPIRTVPDVLDEVPRVVPTGNAWVALPDVDAATGAVGGLTLLHERAGGLIELTGDPLLRATVRLDGAAVPARSWTLHLDAGLLPRFTATVRGCELTLVVCAPPEHRGLLYRLTCTRAAGDVEGGDVEVELTIEGSFSAAVLHVFSARPLPGPHRRRWDPWTRTLTWEAGAGLPVAGLAVRGDDGAEPEVEGIAAAVAGLDPEGSPPPTRWRHRRTASLAPGQGTGLTVVCGVGREADGAALAAVDLARRRPAELVRETRAWLEARHGPALPDRPGLQALRDRNRLFCLVFAAGRAIDTEELALVTSRSPRYYVSGAHWTRDSLLWAFPAVLAVDAASAGAWLSTAFGRYARNAGIHALYLDGGVLYPGFELDEVCAFHLALDRYLEATDDEALLDDEALRTGLHRVDRALDGARDPGCGLYRTFLLPTDDPAPLPFVTYDNALTVAALRARARTRSRLGDTVGAEASRREASALWAAILDRAVVEGPEGPMLCGATDGTGGHVLFDEPPGSLELLAHYGLVPADDPVWRATVAWVWSAANPHGPGAGPYATPVCDHAHHPWLLTVGNALLRGEHRWLEALPRLPLDNGFACETFDAHTGEPRTGVGFATCAGWLAHAIDVATGPEDPTAPADPTAADPAVSHGPTAPTGPTDREVRR